MLRYLRNLFLKPILARQDNLEIKLDEILDLCKNLNLINEKVINQSRDASNEFTLKKLMGNTDNNYQNRRKNLEYYTYLFKLIKAYTTDAKSAIDIGSNGIPFIEVLDWIPKKYSLDMVNPYESDKVIGIKQNFLEYPSSLSNESKNSFDVVICAQVLEHVENPCIFAEKLLELGKQVFISLPYKWPEGSCKPHIHDMIDENVIFSWTQREPDYSVIVDEIVIPKHSCSRRIINYYDNR